MIAPRFLFAVAKHGRSLGASEDLIVEAAERLAARGQAPTFWFNFRPSESDARIQILRRAGCRIHCFDSSTVAHRILHRLGFKDDTRPIRRSFFSVLLAERPSLVILNQGGNSDAGVEAAVLKEAGTPYAVLSHGATEGTWPDPGFLHCMRGIFVGARRCLFVSEAIRQLTEAQIGKVITNATVVHNTCKFRHAEPIPWPDDEAKFSLAVVARMENKSKGHDLVVRVLAQPEWRARALTVTFYGDGPHREPLVEYAADLGLNSVRFAGHVGDVRSIWSRHTAVIQASRFEGYGLSLVEAMFCGRMAIATRFPAAVEFVRDEETGFLARAASVEELSLALEHAWAQKHRWREMGAAAAALVSERYPKDPVGDFQSLLEAIT